MIWLLIEVLHIYYYECAFFLSLDVEGIKYVVNYDYPNSSEDYIHRIGRTARSDSTGTSYAFFTPTNSRQARDLVAVLREANQVIQKLYNYNELILVHMWTGSILASLVKWKILNKTIRKSDGNFQVINPKLADIANRGGGYGGKGGNYSRWGSGGGGGIGGRGGGSRFASSRDSGGRGDAVRRGGGGSRGGVVGGRGAGGFRGSRDTGSRPNTRFSGPSGGGSGGRQTNGFQN